MVQEIGPNAAVDALHAKSFGELAQGKHDNGQVLDSPVADGERFDAPLCPTLPRIAEGQAPW
jgi:hypothetical protein